MSSIIKSALQRGAQPLLRSFRPIVANATAAPLQCMSTGTGKGAVSAPPNFLSQQNPPKAKPSIEKQVASKPSKVPELDKPFYVTESRTNAKSLVSYPKTRVTTLPSGLRIATETSPHAATATVGVWIDTGSRYESAATNGVAHFLEHMSFKGTNRRSRQTLEMEVENLGGHLNAYTSREQTVYYAKVLKKDTAQALDILSDMLLNSKIEEEGINRERETILREMKEVDQQMNEVIFDRLHQTAYRGTALGRTILGSAENINSITQADIKQYIARHYTAPRMVVAGAGAIDHDELVKLTEKLFKNVPTSAPAGQEPYMEPAVFTGSDILVRYDDMAQAHIAIGYPTGGFCDSDNIPLMLIQSMLGSWERSVHGGMHSSSKLVSTVAKFELCHSISPFNTQYSDTGLFGLYAVCGPTDCNNVVWAITNALTTLCYKVDDALLAEAKNNLKFSILASLDGTTSVCEDIGRQMLTYGRRMHPSEMLARIESVDSAAVKACANRFFFDRDHACAAIGPLHELPDYNFIRSRSYFFRY